MSPTLSIWIPASGRLSRPMYLEGEWQGGPEVLWKSQLQKEPSEDEEVTRKWGSLTFRGCGVKEVETGRGGGASRGLWGSGQHTQPGRRRAYRRGPLRGRSMLSPQGFLCSMCTVITWKWAVGVDKEHRRGQKHFPVFQYWEKLKAFGTSILSRGKYLQFLLFSRPSYINS